jgi:hypothetical protein
VSLSDTLAEIEALSQGQRQQASMAPPPGSPQRPNVPLLTPAPKPAPTPAKKSFMQSAADVIGSIGKAAQDPSTYSAIGAGLVRAPGQLLGGLSDTMEDIDHFRSDSIDPSFLRKPFGQAMAMASDLTSPKHLLEAMNPMAASLSAVRRNQPQGASLADVLSARKSLGQVGNPDINQMAAQGGAIMLPLVGAPEAAASTLTAKVGKLLLNSAKVGAATAVTADATGTPQQRATQRVQEGAIGAGVNVVAEPLIGAVSEYIKGKLPTKVTKASPADALKDKLDRDFASARTSEARYQAQEAASKSPDTAQSEPSEVHHLAQGTRVADGTGEPGGAGDAGGLRPQGGKGAGEPAPTGGPDGAPSEPDHLAYQDANHALKAVGSTETVDPATHPTTPDGRIPVSAASKAALDEAGMGRAFSAAEDAGLTRADDPVIFKEEDPQGGSRVVGQIGKEDLEGFKAAATIEDLAPDHPVGQWKLSNLGTSYDVPAFLRGLAEQLPEHEVLTDNEVMATAKKAADSIGWEPEDMIAFAAHVAGDAKQLPAAMATIRTVYARAAQSVDDLLHLREDWGSLADDHPDLKRALEAVHNIITLGQSVAEFKTAAGRTLRVAGLPDADAYMASFGRSAPDALKPVDPLDGLPRLPRNKDELKQWLDAWDYTKGDPTSREAFIKGLTFMPGKWMQLRTSFANFFTAAIISAPSTFLRDLLGPAIIGSLRTIERTTGGYAAALNPFVDGATRQQLLRSASQAPQAYIQTIGAMADSLRAAARATTSGGQLLQPHTVYDFRSKIIPDGLIQAATQANPGVTGRIPYVLANAVNVFPGWIHALHGGVNEFAQRLSYLGEVRASAMLEAAQNGLKGDDATAYVKQRLMNSTDEVTWAANDKGALESSQRTTLIKPVGGDNQPIVSRFSDFIHAMRTNFPESRYIIPIFTVPANAIGEGVRRIPIVGQLFAETAQELSGQAGAAAQAEAYGRVLSGASLMMGGMAMARAGLLTGPGPADPRARQVWEAQGFQPYSMRIGDKWVSYNRMDVVGNLLAIPAAIYDKSVHTQMDNESATFAGVAALAQYFKDQAALQGISELMSFGGSPNESEHFLSKLANTTAGGFVPNFITQIGRNNLDPDKRVVRNPFEAILNKLPGASSTLDPQRNPLGEETQKVQNSLLNLLPISLTTANSYAKDPVVDELDRLYQVTGYAPGLKSPALPGGKTDMRDVKLEDGHSLYDALVRYRGIVTNDEGLKLRPALQALFDSPDYAQAVDGDGNNLRTANGDLDRGAMVAQLLHKFDAQAQHEVAQQSPTAARYLAVGAIKQQNDAFLRDHPTEDLAKDPSLLGSLGINLRDYEDKVRGQ